MLGATLSGPITFVESGSGRLPSLTNPIKLSGRVSYDTRERELETQTGDFDERIYF